MEIIIAVIIIGIVLAFYFNKPALDVNKDGKVDAKDAVEAAVKVEEVVKTEVTAVAKKAKSTATKAKAKVAEVEGKVVTAAKKTAKPKKPKA